jgi:hypothetical protein
MHEAHTHTHTHTHTQRNPTTVQHSPIPPTAISHAGQAFASAGPWIRRRRWQARRKARAAHSRRSATSRPPLRSTRAAPLPRRCMARARCSLGWVRGPRIKRRVCTGKPDHFNSPSQKTRAPHHRPCRPPTRAGAGCERECRGEGGGAAHGKQQQAAVGRHALRDISVLLETP